VWIRYSKISQQNMNMRESQFAMVVSTASCLIILNLGHLLQVQSSWTVGNTKSGGSEFTFTWSDYCLGNVWLLLTSILPTAALRRNLGYQVACACDWPSIACSSKRQSLRRMFLHVPKKKHATGMREMECRNSLHHRHIHSATTIFEIRKT
jgi:hypothetical protein